jgi:hypothetical protein
MTGAGGGPNASGLPVGVTLCPLTPETTAGKAAR